MFRLIKDWYRRGLATRHGVVADLQADTFTAGERSGVWTVIPHGLGPDSVVYSFGVGDNLAWELAMIDCFGLTVHAFDPTPASVAWVARQPLPEPLRFHPVGLAGHDGALRFDLPRRGSRFNFRPSAAGASTSIEAPVARLSTLRSQLGHARIDVLKMDIEGGEYDAIDDLLACGVLPRQLLVEFHHHFPGVGVEKTGRAVHALRRAGYRIFHVSARGLEVSFLRA